MPYIGIYSQIKRNQFRTTLLLLGFPLLILLIIFAVTYFFQAPNTSFGGPYRVSPIQEALKTTLAVSPFVLGVVAIWFLIAYYSHAHIIEYSASSETLSRRDYPRIYNLTENLCIAMGMNMPRLRVIDTTALNAFASGINEKSYAVTLTTGLINHLNDDELEGVIAHELIHIKNQDVRLLIVTIIFVGIFSFIAHVLSRFMYRASRGSSDNKGKVAAWVATILVVLLAYLLSMVFKFAISRKREYMADAGAADLTKKPRALASALRKISQNHDLTQMHDDLKQLCIANHVQKKAFSVSSWFATHPPIDKRIAILEGF